MSSRDREFDVAVVGSGPASVVAAHLVAVLGHRVLAVRAPDSDPVAQPDLHILLPHSALATLARLGAHAAVIGAGAPLLAHELHGVDGENDAPPGHGGGLQIAESTLRETLIRELQPAPEVLEGRVVELVREGGAVTGVALEDGSRVRSAMTLCATPELLHPSERPRPAGASDRVCVDRLATISAERFPGGGHFLELLPQAWGWALRVGEQVQYSRFEDDGPDTDPGLPTGSHLDGDPAPIANRMAVRTLTPTIPASMDTPGLLPFGRASFSASPLSSLGTSHGLTGAFAAAVAARSLMAGVLDPVRVRDWYTETTRLRALRTHALVSLAARGPAEVFDTGFWTTRARDDWRHPAPAPLADAAERARTFLDRSRSGDVLEQVFRWPEGVRRETGLVARGPELVETPLLHLGSGVGFDPSSVPDFPALVQGLRADAPLGEVLDGRLSEIPAGPEREARRKLLAQAVGRLHECGILEID